MRCCSPGESTLAQSFTSSSRSVYSGSATDSSAAHNVSSGISRDRCLRFRLTVLWVASGHDDRRLREELWRFSIGVARVLHNPWDNGVDLAAGAIASTCSAATELAQGAAPLLSAPVRWPAEGCAPHTTATPSASTERNHAAPTCVSRDGAFGPQSVIMFCLPPTAARGCASSTWRAQERDRCGRPAVRFTALCFAIIFCPTVTAPHQGSYRYGPVVVLVWSSRPSL
jgi:hypothetical protein